MTPERALATIVIVIFGILSVIVVDEALATTDPTTCRDMPVTALSKNLENEITTYTAKTNREEISFSSTLSIEIGTVVTVCDKKSFLHRPLVPSIYLKAGE